MNDYEARLRDNPQPDRNRLKFSAPRLSHGIIVITLLLQYYEAFLGSGKFLAWHSKSSFLFPPPSPPPPS